MRRRSRWDLLGDGYGLPVLLFAALLGVLAGLGAFTFVYAKGFSYFSSDPKACTNCHVMQGHYDAWIKGSHRAVAACNDCHLPAGFFNKWLTKGLNGFHHSYAFTTGDFPETIRITDRNRGVTEAACRRCHGDVVQMMDGPATKSEPLSCLRCHEDVGHMELD